MSLLVASQLAKTYTSGSATVSALAGVSLTIERRRFRGAHGPVGLRQVDAAAPVRRDGSAQRGQLGASRAATCALTDDELTRVRRDRIGFVFQFFNLLPTLTLGDNIALPCLLARRAACDEADGAGGASSPTRVGIEHRLRHYPQQVSGGEMQRAAIARALVHQPCAADRRRAHRQSRLRQRRHVLALLAELNRETGITILLATHAAEVAAAAGRVIRMRDGRLADDSAVPLPHARPRAAAAV